jgi:cyclomaltodextrinase
MRLSVFPALSTMLSVPESISPPSQIRPFRFFPSLVITALILFTWPIQAEGPVARKSPQWVRDAVVYEVFTRNFSASGDFNGLTARLPELKNLGVTVLWFMPLHPIGEKLRKGTLGSPYAVKDYYAIAPELGTTNDFKHLVTEAHAQGLKVIIDIVANHTAWDSVVMEQYPEFYKRDGRGKIIPPVPDWADVAGLNYGNSQLREYMITMLKYWLVEFDLDGFRCDVAHMVPTDFWEQARAELEKVKPEVLLLAEASKPDLLVSAFDLDYSWPLHGALNGVLLDNKPASALRSSWESTRQQFPGGALHLRFSDNHDEPRAIARFGIRGALVAQAFMFTLDGVPLIYNGMEVGDATESGDPALFEKMPIFWKPKDRPRIREIYRDLAKLRSQHPAFHNDQVTWLRNSDDRNVASFMRQDDKEQFVVLLNFSSRPASGIVELTNADQFKPVHISGMPDAPSSDFPAFHLDGFAWRIYRRSTRN